MEKFISSYLVENFQILFLIFIRITALYFTAPFFNNKDFPKTIMAAFAFLTAIIIFPIVGGYTPPFPNVNGLSFLLNVLNQVVIGISIGLIASIFMIVFQLSGQYFTVQIGFGMINTLDPFSEQQISILGILQGIVAMFIFLYLNMHHFLLYAIVKSFQFFPVFEIKHFAYSFKVINNVMLKVFYLAFLFGLPIIGTIFLTTLVMGISAKVAPQMNVLMLGFPLKIFIGLLTLLLLQPFLFEVTVKLLHFMKIYLNSYLQYAR